VIIMTNAATFQREVQMDRFGLKVAALLDEQALPHDISERLRVARQQAVAQRKLALAAQAQPKTAESIFSAGSSAILGGEGSDWISRLVGVLPLLALVVGLVMINSTVNQERATELADVDIQLLTDDLPPAAHTDPGFAQFLKFGPPSATSNP
jgi:Protein of unknown function (DUF3619)